MADKEKETKTSKKKTALEKEKEKQKAAVQKEKEKQQAKQKEKEKQLLEKEKEKQKAAVEKEREKQKEQQKLAITNAIAKEREKQKDAQAKAIEKAIAKERAKIREALVSGKDPFAKENPLSKAQLKKAVSLAEKDEKDFDEAGMASLAQKLNEKKSFDDLLKEKENKEPIDNGEEKLNHVELLRRKRQAMDMLNSSKDEEEDKKSELRAKLHAENAATLDVDDDADERVEALEKEKANLEAKITNLLEELDHKNEIINSQKEKSEPTIKEVVKEVVKEVEVDNPELQKKVNALESEKANLELKITNLLEELDSKNELVKSKDQEINVLGLELAKYKDSEKGTLPAEEVTPEVEEIKITGDLLLKIQSLQKRIEEKNAEIKVVEDELNQMTEKDIVDKEFLVAVKRIREERNEIVRSSNETLKVLAELVIKNEDKYNTSKKVFEDKTEELNAFDKDYAEKKDTLSYNEKEEIMRKRSRLCAEIDASKFNLDFNKESYDNYFNRYNNELSRAEKAVSELNEKEKALISEYLEKLKEAKSNDNEEYQIQVEERERLLKELEDANKEALAKAKQEELVIKTKENINPDEDEVLVNLKSSLAQIGGKLVMINNKRAERNNVEKVLRTTDESVKEYLKLYSEKETLSFVISEDQKRLNKVNVEIRDNPLKAKKGFLGRVKYDQKDLDADKKRKDDVERLEALITQNKAKFEALEEEIKKYDYNEKVLFYKKLLASISELNARESEFKKRELEIKESIINRENELKGN